MNVSWQDAWMLFGAGLALLYAVGHGFSRHSGPVRACLVALFVSIAVIQLSWWWVLNQQAQEHPVWWRAHYVALFLIGPCVYVFSRLLRSESPPWRVLVRHFLPAGVALVWAISGTSAATGPVPDAWPVALSSALGAAYVGDVFWRLWQVPGKRPYLLAETAVLGVLTAIGALVALASLTGGLLESPWFYRTYLSMITLVMVVSHLLAVRFPELIHYLAERSPPRPAGKSTLTGIEPRAVLARIRAHMDEDQWFQEEALTLAGLASRAGLSAHQLSELLNEHAGCNFTRFIKEYRVAAASRRLLDEPDTPILDIGLAAGFSSSSAFYSAFREVRGMAPGQFRKQGISADATDVVPNYLSGSLQVSDSKEKQK